MDKILTMLKNIVLGLHFDSLMKQKICDRFLLSGFNKASVNKLRKCSIEQTSEPRNGLTTIIYYIKKAIVGSGYSDNDKERLLRAVFYLSKDHLQRYDIHSLLLKKYCQFFTNVLREKFTNAEIESIAYCNPIFFIEELSDTFSEINIGDVLYNAFCDDGPNYDSTYKKVTMTKINAISSYLTNNTISVVEEFPITHEMITGLESVLPNTKGLEWIVKNVLPEGLRNIYILYFGLTPDRKPFQLDEIKDTLQYDSIDDVKAAMSIAYNLIMVLLVTSKLPTKVQNYVRANFKYVEFPITQKKVDDYILCVEKMLLLGEYQCDNEFRNVLLGYLNKLLEIGNIGEEVYALINGILMNTESAVDEDKKVLIGAFIRAYRFYLFNNHIYCNYMENIVKSVTEVNKASL